MMSEPKKRFCEYCLKLIPIDDYNGHLETCGIFHKVQSSKKETMKPEIVLE